MAQILVDIVYSFGHCLSCFPSSPTLKVNNRSLKILQLLGEGGFSYVYLVEDTSTKELLALKKIRCPFGAESVEQAMREVDAYRLFRHVPGIITAVDHAVATERGAVAVAADDDDDDGAAAKTVYVLLPYYRRGNLQDMINANLVNHARFPEHSLMALFLAVCKALRGMHDYRAPPAQRMKMGHETDDADADVDDDDNRALAHGRSRSGGGGGGGGPSREQDGHETEQERLLEESENQMTSGGKIKAYAHRDIKPGNIMIDDSGSNPILMDLGSVVASPTPITSQSVALQVQETAAEHSTMPYRAPELFDVQTGDGAASIDTKVDIWSLGCTLFACLVGKSPFEMRADESGGSLSLCILGGDWRFPDQQSSSSSSHGGAAAAATTNATASTAADGKRVNSIQMAKAKAKAAAASSSGGSSGQTTTTATTTTTTTAISHSIRDIVRACLQVEPSHRPDIHQLITMVENCLQNLPPPAEP